MTTQGDRIWVVKIDEETGALVWEFQGPNQRFPYEESVPLDWPDATYFGPGY